MPLDEPRLIIETQPIVEGAAEVLHGLERMHPQPLLLERPNEPLRDPVAFRGAYECRARRHPEKPEFGLEVLAHRLTAVIMPHLHARRTAGRERAELLTHALTNRFQGLEARGAPRRMDADPFEGAMIHADEDRDGPVLPRHRAGRIGAPHLIRALGRDPAVVGPGSQDALGPAGRQEASRPHESQHARLRGANPLRPQARPDFAGPFAEKGRGREHLPDVRGEHLVGVRRLRATLGRLGGRPRGAVLVVIVRRPAHAPFLTDSHHALAALLGRRQGVAHRVDLPVAKGTPPRRRWTASRDSSSRMVRSPTNAFSRASSASRPSAARLFKPAWPLVTKWSRHSDSVAAVIPASRETRSRSSPSSTRNTTSTFLREDNRPRSVFDFAIDTSVIERAVCPNRVSKEIVGRRSSRLVRSNGIRALRLIVRRSRTDCRRCTHSEL